MIPEKFIYIGISISLIGIFFYIKDIISGDTKPNRVSWFFWMLAPFVGAYLQFKAGAGLSVLAILISGIGPLLVLIASFIWNKNSYWKITVFDILCGLFALVALVIYIFTNKFAISIAFAILSDLLAGIPTLIKSWKFPETETGFEYICSVLNALIGISVIKNWSFSIYSFGVYLVIFNLTIVYFVYRKIFTPKLDLGGDVGKEILQKSE